MYIKASGLSIFFHILNLCLFFTWNSNSPHHANGNGKKEAMLELQSFYHHHYHAQNGDNLVQKGRPPTSGNYALPYDILPVSRDNSNVAIYGQCLMTSVNGQQQSVSSQQPSAEPLYATTKPVVTYNNYCQKVCIKHTKILSLFRIPNTLNLLLWFFIFRWMIHNQVIQVVTIHQVEPTTNH